MNITSTDGLLLVIRILLAAVFVVAGIAKLRDRAGARKTAVDLGVPDSMAGAVAVLLPIAELATALALLPVATAWWGALGVMGLLILFSAAMAVALARGRAVDCRCFGQVSPSRIGPATLVRNLVLAVMAGSIVFGGVGSGLRSSIGALDAGQILNLTLASIIVLGVVVLTQVLKQYGKLLLRIEALESRVGVPAPPAGLPVGNAAPSFSLEGLDGRRSTLATLGGRGKPVLLVFVAPDCAACDALLPELGAWQREHGDQLTIALISQGAGETRKKVKGHSISNVLLETAREVTDSYKVPATPGAVLLKDGAVATPVATGPDAIRALVLEATLPPPVKRGDALPSMTVRTLEGGSLDLATLRGRVLMLFWSPGCGFCQQMLEDVKRWETQAAGALKLIVTSSGSEAEIRAQGFGAPVIVDQDGSVMRIFGAGGTPSAVLIKDGRVVSDLESGAPSVWKLAGVTQAVPA